MLRPPTSLLPLLLPIALTAACQPLDPELDGFDQKSSDLISSFAMTAPRDATPFTQVYTNERTGWQCGHMRPTQVRSVMVCMNTGWGTLPTLARLQDMMVSTQNYFRFSSQNRFQLGNTTFVGCGGATGTLNKKTTSPIGWHARVVHEALEQARSQLNFDFAALDTNRDGQVMPDEALVTVMLGNTPDPARPKGGNPAGARRPLDRTRNFNLGSVNFVDVLDCSFQGVDNTEVDRVAKYGTMAHEIMHQLFDAKDMYGMTIFGAGGDSLMDQHFDGSVLDPFHAIKLGWQNVRAYPIRHANFPLTMLNFGAAEIVVLYDPALMAKEYFLIENRSDQLLVWRIVEDVTRLNASPWIANKEIRDAIPAGQWARHVIHKVATGIKKASGATTPLMTAPLIMTSGDTGWVVRVRDNPAGQPLVVTVERPAKTDTTTSFNQGQTRSFGPFRADKGIKAIVTGTTPDVDLTIFRETAGSRQAICSSATSSSNEECMTDEAGTYHVQLSAYSGKPTVRLTVHY